MTQHKQVKGKVIPYSLLSIGPGADPGVQAVSLQVTWSHPPGGRVPLLSARPAVTFPTEERPRPSAGTMHRDRAKTDDTVALVTFTFLQSW